MTATRHTRAASHETHIAFGGYSRDGAEHTVVAVRDHAAPWLAAITVFSPVLIIGIPHLGRA